MMHCPSTAETFRMIRNLSAHSCGRILQTSHIDIPNTWTWCVRVDPHNKWVVINCLYILEFLFHRAHIYRLYYMCIYRYLDRIVMYSNNTACSRCNIYSTVGRSISNIYNPRPHIYRGVKHWGKYTAEVVHRGYGLTYRTILYSLVSAQQKNLCLKTLPKMTPSSPGP